MIISMSAWTENGITVAGGTGEIGRRVVEQLYPKGEILIVGRDKEKFQALQKSFPKARFQHIDAYQGDGTVFINAIGSPCYFKADQFSAETARVSYHDNFEIPALLISRALQNMKKNGRGWIININSLSGLHGYPDGGGYVPFKFALRGFLETARKERGRADIRISEIYPGIIDTHFSSALPFSFDRAQAISPVKVTALIAWMVREDIYLSHVEWPNDKVRFSKKKNKNASY